MKNESFWELLEEVKDLIENIDDSSDLMNKNQGESTDDKKLYYLKFEDSY